MTELITAPIVIDSHVTAKVKRNFYYKIKGTANQIKRMSCAN